MGRKTKVKSKYRHSKNDLEDRKELLEKERESASQQWLRRQGIEAESHLHLHHHRHSHHAKKSGKNNRRKRNQQDKDLDELAFSLSSRAAKVCAKAKKSQSSRQDRDKIRAKLQVALAQVQSSLDSLDQQDSQDAEQAINGLHIHKEEQEEEPISGAFLNGATSGMSNDHLDCAAASLINRRRSKRTRISKNSEKRICDLFKAAVNLGEKANTADRLLEGDSKMGEAAKEETSEEKVASAMTKALLDEALPFKVVSKKELEASSWREDEKWQRQHKQAKKKAKRRRKEEARQQKKYEKAVERGDIVDNKNNSATNFVMRSPTLQL